MPEPTQKQINLYDLNADKKLTEEDVEFARAIGMNSIAFTIQDILETGQGALDITQAGLEMSGEKYQTYLADPVEIRNNFNASNQANMDRVLSTFQSVVSTSPAPGSVKTVIDWATFWSESNVPVLGYDAIDNKVVVLKGSDNSADSSKDILVYDLITGTFTKGDTKFSGTNDISNMIADPATGELVAMHNTSSAGSNLKRFKAHQSANISSSTVNIVTPFFDFGSSGNSKRLYKVKVLCTGTNLDDLAIVASYDGDTDTYSSIFSSNAFANITDSANWDTQTFTVSSPTDFTNISIKIYSTGAMTTANWGISEIAFVYREKGIR